MIFSKQTCRFPQRIKIKKENKKQLLMQSLNLQLQ